MRVTIDRDVCIGAGNCVRLARGAFALDDEEVAVVLDAAAATPGHIEMAVRSCPTGAISVTGDE
jgi:ferredoxin